MTTSAQPDLFSGAGEAAPPRTAPPGTDTLHWTQADPARLSDRDVIAMIPRATQAEAPGLAREAATRGLADAVPALETLCRRFAGFGLDRAVTEQTVSLQGLAALGGKPATEAVARLITGGAVRGPGLRHALEAAAHLGCTLPPDRIAAFLRDDNPEVRIAACRCVRSNAAIEAILIDLLSDLRPSVTHAAAIALGRLGRREGIGILLHLLRTAPSAEVAAALAPVAGDDDMVRLGQTALAHPDLALCVLDALDDIDSPRAAAVAAGVRRRIGL